MKHAYNIFEQSKLDIVMSDGLKIFKKMILISLRLKKINGIFEDNSFKKPYWAEIENFEERKRTCQYFLLKNKIGATNINHNIKSKKTNKI